MRGPAGFLLSRPSALLLFAAMRMWLVGRGILLASRWMRAHRSLLPARLLLCPIRIWLCWKWSEVAFLLGVFLLMRLLACWLLLQVGFLFASLLLA